MQISLGCHNGKIDQKEVACTGEAWSRDGDRVGACASPCGSSWQPRADIGRERGDLGWKSGSRPPAAVLVSPETQPTAAVVWPDSHGDFGVPPPRWEVGRKSHVICDFNHMLGL